MFLPPANTFITFFWSLSKGDSTITLMANAYMNAYKVSPQNRHACNAKLFHTKNRIRALTCVLYLPLMLYFGTSASSWKQLFAIEWFLGTCRRKIRVLPEPGKLDVPKSRSHMYLKEQNKISRQSMGHLKDFSTLLTNTFSALTYRTRLGHGLLYHNK